MVSGKIAQKKTEKDPASSFEVEWFQRMGDALKWRLITPDFTSPFRPSYSDLTLSNFAKSIDALLKACELKCICEGYEVLHARNLKAFIISTDHPCLTSLKNGDFAYYLRESGIFQDIVTQLESVQEMLRAELKIRDQRAIVEGSNIIESAKKRAEEARKQAEVANRGKSGNLSRRIRK